MLNFSLLFKICEKFQRSIAIPLNALSFFISSIETRPLSRARSSLAKSSSLFPPFFPRPFPQFHPPTLVHESRRRRRRHQGVRIPTSRHGWPPPWSNCFAGINIHLASATRLLATAERNCRSSTTIIAASHCPESWDRSAPVARSTPTNREIWFARLRGWKDR